LGSGLAGSLASTRTKSTICLPAGFAAVIVNLACAAFNSTMTLTALSLDLGQYYQSPSRPPHQTHTFMHAGSTPPLQEPSRRQISADPVLLGNRVGMTGGRRLLVGGSGTALAAGCRDNTAPGAGIRPEGRATSSAGAVSVAGLAFGRLSGADQTRLTDKEAV